MAARELLLLTRRTAGLSQAELASRLGRPRSTIARWELGETEPPYNAVMDVIAACDMAAAVTLAAADSSYLGDVGERLRLEPLQRLQALHGGDRATVVMRLAELDAEAIIIGDAAAALLGWPLLLPAGEPVELCVPGGAGAAVKDTLIVEQPPGTRGYLDLRRDSERLAVPGGHVTVASPLDLLRIARAGREPVQAGALEAILEHRRRWPNGPPARHQYGDAEARETIDAWLSSQK